MAQKHRLLRSQADLDFAILRELFRVSAEKFTCPQCGRKGLTTKPSEPLNEEEWGMARNCSECGIVIPAERLEVFPEATLCPNANARTSVGSLHARRSIVPVVAKR